MPCFMKWRVVFDIRVLMEGAWKLVLVKLAVKYTYIYINIERRQTELPLTVQYSIVIPIVIH